MLVCSNNHSYYIKDTIKNIIYSTIPSHERFKIHKYLHQLYSEQIPKKPDERILKISRKLLHSEQYYHFICYSRLEKDHGSSQKYQIAPSYIKEIQGYLPAGMIENLSWSGREIKENTSVVDPVLNQARELEVKLLSEALSTEFDSSKFGIELTDEEKDIIEKRFRNNQRRF